MSKWSWENDVRSRKSFYFNFELLSLRIFKKHYKCHPPPPTLPTEILPESTQAACPVCPLPYLNCAFFLPLKCKIFPFNLTYMYFTVLSHKVPYWALNLNPLLPLMRKKWIKGGGIFLFVCWIVYYFISG